MLGETEKSSDVCRTASLSEMGHEQRAATSSTVTDQRRKNLFVRKSSFEIEVPPNRAAERRWPRLAEVAHHCKVDIDSVIDVIDLCQREVLQEAQLMLTNPRDAFRGQSRSPNIVPCHMLGIVSYCAIVTLSLRRVRFSDIRLQKYRDLEIRVRGHSRSFKVVPFDRLRMVSY